MDIAELLTFSVKNKASDLHLSAGLPPMIRVDGDIRKINIPPISLVCLAFGAGLVQLCIAATFLEGAPKLNLSSITFMALIYLGIIPTALGQVFRFSLIKKVGYSVFALALNLIPVFGIVLGALILGEIITLRTFLALALVLAGLLISQLGDRNKA